MNSTALHYIGALAVVILGVWIADALGNPIAGVITRK